MASRLKDEESELERQKLQSLTEALFDEQKIQRQENS